jgi:DNA polymerase I-like protein with 3'-5' exonuclease and polymerase domains
MIPFISIYLRAVGIEKLLSTFLVKMARGILRPTFDVLKNTGRTSSFGDISAQNLPRDSQIRSLFVPSPGHVFINADYSAVEMATLAQASLSQFGGRSEIGNAINADIDLHRLVASRLTGKPVDQITPEERQKAKAVNFGLPGGMGVKSLRQYARMSYKTELTEGEAQALYDVWFGTFPEMSHFLGKHDDTANLGIEIANLLSITEVGYAQATGRYVATDTPQIAMLGWMARKVFGEEFPASRHGRQYDESVCDYFWERLDTAADRLIGKHRQSVANRTPSKELATAVSNLAGQSGVLTLTGRLRSHTAYCARHNTIFQGLAADGAKLAVWKLWRNGFRIVNFIHDEFLIEVPKQDDPALYRESEETIKRLMVEGMQEVVPDVKIKVESSISDCWKK